MRRFLVFVLLILLADDLTAKKDDYITFNLISARSKTPKLIRVKKFSNIKQRPFIVSPKKSINENFDMLIRKLKKR